MPNEIVNTFNVENENYHFDAPMDNLPVGGSKKAVMSGGVWQKLQEESILANEQLQDMVFWPSYFKIWQHLSGAAGIHEIKYAEGIYVGATGRVLSTQEGAGCRWSENGIDWYSGTGDLDFGSMSVQGLMFSGNEWICVGYNNFIYRSTDGKSWAHVTELRRNWQYLCYGNGVWVCGSQSGIYYSTDGGQNWSASSISSLDTWAIEFNNGVFVASVYDSDISKCFLYWSEDGAHWTKVQIISENTGYNGILYIDGVWLFTTYYFSVDGKNWVRRTGVTNAVGDLRDVMYAFGKFFLVGSTGKCAFASPNEMHQLNYSAGSYLSLYFAHGALYALGDKYNNSDTVRTTDGSTWATVSGLATSGEQNVWLYTHGKGMLFYKYGVWVFANGSKLRVSYDDWNTWTDIGTYLTRFLYSLNDSKLLATGLGAGYQNSSFEDLFNVGTPAP